MFIISRKEKYSVKNFEVEIKHDKVFLDRDFYPIKFYLEDKGLVFNEPTILDGWDATFIYRKLKNTYINPASKDLELFLYMRLRNSRPIWIEHQIDFI